MAESQPIKISTSKYTKKGKVDIDGNIWEVVLPGAGTELRFSQASRACKLYGARIDLLDKKINNGTVTVEELDTYETYSHKYESSERTIYEVFHNTFRDGTKDNASVKTWVNDTPTTVIMMAFEDVKDQAKNQDEPTSEPTSKESA